MTKNHTLLKWLEEMKELLTPDQVAICTVQTPMTLHVLRTAHSSALRQKRMQVLPITGVTLRKCMKSFIK